ncbi:MAG: 2Fe-2S iron-sulfur cluster-binding protein [Syntrophomonadaceae bacterium]|nr:2Fe-2S iron-sulfur cluster-binding protein [Syntrophomonadaceae bacterium]
MFITINNRQIEVQTGETILQVCRRENIFIPTFCYHEAFGGQGACRMCMVEVKENGRNKNRLVAACTYPVTATIEVFTESDRVQQVRRTLVMLLKRRAAQDPYIEELAHKYEAPLLPKLKVDPQGCILCRLCILACEKMGKSAIWTVLRGIDKRIATPYDEETDECMGCKACAEICPTQAITFLEDGEKRSIWNKTFTLVSCERCGKPYATREQLEYMREQTGYETAQICEPCRKKTLASQVEKYQN